MPSLKTMPFPLMGFTYLALTQVALIAALCCAGPISGQWWFILLLHPVPTSADAGPDLCMLHPDLSTLHSHLDLWCFPFFNWCKHSTCTGGECHLLQLAMVVLFPAATSADSPLAHVVVCTLSNLQWWFFFIQPLAQILHLHPCTQLYSISISHKWLHLHSSHSL